MRFATIFFGFIMLTACGGVSNPAATESLPPSGVTPIAEVQGSGSSSPLAGNRVVISGIVTGDFQDNDADVANNLGGFYVQQETPDGNAMTSEGVFVFDGTNPATDVRSGDRVNVTGTVNEYFGETQITEPTVDVVGSGTVQATAVNLPADGTTTNSDGDLVADFERYEGMLLRFPQTLAVSNLRNLEQFGAVGLSEGGRLFQFTNSNAPDPAAYAAHRASNARRSLELDDGRRSSNPGTIRFLKAGGAGYSIRTGDTVSGVTGNLRYSRGSGGNGNEAWRLMPTAEPEFNSVNPRPGSPTVGGNLHIASFNVLNFFSTVDSGQSVCGPQRNDGCRGADSNQELARQLAKTVSALALLDADIVGLVELENNSSASLQMIVDELNARVGTDEYAFLNTGTVHDDAIKTGFIYKSSSVGLAGAFALLDRSVDSRFNDVRNRPALAQSFNFLANGAKLTVVVNHLKSKGSSCEADGDPNLNDGQGNCNQTRTSAAAAIADWVATDPTNSNDPDYLIIGDLNAYTREDPLTALRDAGFTNLLDARNDAYSFVFDAQAGALDHAIASVSLVPQVVDTIEWHINADEPAVLDYNLEHDRDPALFDPKSPYRASDHDPVIIGLDLTD
ncbi:MAG: ExeM/NucH family extracellular endonuclease [Gammaproteobacteria bacterium]|nr:ExeM/NucH family extracellular endonuclease [Gammaproteobacteria bacterium]NND46406.1 ExeM/NucH family extracellular endonuclease [Woeseiaceae bacterium]NNL44158.1 ExeM/NucH family extracellular endonuclease [Woeseiaceae bacterium]